MSYPPNIPFSGLSSQGRGTPVGYGMTNMIPPMGYGMYPGMIYPGPGMYGTAVPNLGKRAIDWVEYKTQDGKNNKYWGNNITKETTWEEPTPVRQEREKREAEEAIPEEAGWIQISDHNNKTYYKNKTTNATQTSMPKEVRDFRKKKEAEKIAAAVKHPTPETKKPSTSETNTTKTTQMPARKTTQITEREKPLIAVVQSPQSERVYESKSERKEVFKQMLHDLKINTNLRYEEVVRLILIDNRYDALRSKKDRSAAFDEYCKSVEKKIKDQQAEELKDKSEAFNEMLASGRAQNMFSDAISYNSVKQIFKKDDRFVSIENDSLRKKLSQEFMNEMMRQKATEERERKHHNMVEFGELLKNEGVKRNEKWTRISRIIDTKDKKYTALSEKERKQAFDEYIKHLINIDENAISREAHCQRQRSRNLRKSFIIQIKKDIEDGSLHQFIPIDDYLENIDGSFYRNLHPNEVEDLFLCETTDLTSQYPVHNRRLKKLVIDGTFKPLEESDSGSLLESYPSWAVSAFKFVCRSRQSDRRSLLKSITNRLVDNLYCTLGQDVSWPTEALSYFKSEPFWFDLLEFNDSQDEWIPKIQKNFEKLVAEKKKKNKRTDRERSPGRKRRKD